MSNFKVKPRPHGEWQAICPTCGPFAKGASPAIANDMCRAHVCRWIGPRRYDEPTSPIPTGQVGSVVASDPRDRWWGTPPRGEVWV